MCAFFGSAASHATAVATQRQSKCFEREPGTGWEEERGSGGGGTPCRTATLYHPHHSLPRAPPDSSADDVYGLIPTPSQSSSGTSSPSLRDRKGLLWGGVCRLFTPPNMAPPLGWLSCRSAPVQAGPWSRRACNSGTAGAAGRCACVVRKGSSGVHSDPPHTSG